MSLPLLKPYRALPIVPCDDPMEPLDGDLFAFFDPPPYKALGAPYGEVSPWQLRKAVHAGLKRAANRLSALKSGWKIRFYDAYRPNAVQAFMVEREYALQAKKQGLDPLKDREALAPSVWRLWAIPSEDPATPPLHATGAAFDCTLQDGQGTVVPMGGDLDENSDRSLPDYYKNATKEEDRRAHENRLLLRNILRAEGFQPHLTEWWHFSLGDQYWAWREREEKGGKAVAIYGAVCKPYLTA